MIRHIFAKLKELYVRRSSDSYIAFLRDKGIKIGEGTYIQSPKTTEIDDTRPSLITIGRNCFINKHFEIHSHDWSTHVFLYSGEIS